MTTRKNREVNFFDTMKLKQINLINILKPEHTRNEHLVLIAGRHN